MPPPKAPLAELLAAMSLAADAGHDFPPEKALRTCVLATALARQLGLPDAEVRVVYYAALLRFVGCTGCAQDLAAHFGDDNRVRGTMAGVDRARAEDRSRAFREIGGQRGLIGRARLAAAMMVHGGRVFAQGATADCEVSSRVALRIGFDEATSKALLHAFARWDGQGVPHGVSGDDVVRPARIVHIASFAELRHRAGGANAAIEAVARGAGGWFDPQIVSEFTKTGEDMLSTLEGDSIWDVALEAEPRPRRYASDEDIDKLALAFADLVDLKSSYRLGHSQGVAQLVERACRVLGMPDRAVVDARRAALLHDLGMYSVPTSILDKAGKLTASEQERVRMHAYHTERVLARSALLADIATLASMHHERLDGKGYHRAAPASIVPMAARVLAAADAFQAMTQSRPYRAGLTRDAAAKELTAQALGGGLDRQAARAVCDAAGAQTKIPRGSCGPQGLSEREIEVLRLLARGHSKKQIGKALFIASGTVHTHVTHIYEKIGVSSRAAAALFAMEQGLLP